MATRFCLLGPLQVLHDGRPIPLPAAKHRIVLASLLLRANRVVSADELYQRLWSTALPVEAKKTLQGYIARLRKVLGAQRIETQSPGYLVRIGPGELDLLDFDDLMQQARESEGDPQRASDMLRRALDLWQGEAL